MSPPKPSLKPVETNKFWFRAPAPDFSEPNYELKPLFRQTKFRERLRFHLLFTSFRRRYFDVTSEDYSQLWLYCLFVYQLEGKPDQAQM